MVCNDCKFKADCQLYGNRTYGHKNTCVYKEINGFNSALKNISNTLDETKKSDPEFYKELQELLST